MSQSPTPDELVGFAPEQLIALARMDFATFVAQRLLANGVIIVVMHRLSPDDFSGALEEMGGWCVRKFPLIHEKDTTYLDFKGNVLWAARKGDLLNPAYKNQADVDRLRGEVDSATFDAQCQQRPRYSGT